MCECVLSVWVWEFRECVGVLRACGVVLSVCMGVKSVCVCVLSVCECQVGVGVWVSRVMKELLLVITPIHFLFRSLSLFSLFFSFKASSSLSPPSSSTKLIRTTLPSSLSPLSSTARSRIY